MNDYERIAAAIAFLIEHRADQPSIDEVAQHVGLSRFHFQRVFKHFAGVTPKQFLAALTLEHAKRRLDEGAPVLEAAFDAGLSSPARLHDHFVTIDAMTPGEYKSGGRGLTARYGYAQTPFGLIRVVTTEKGVAMLDFVEVAGELQPEATPISQARFLRDDAVADDVARRAFSGPGNPMNLHVYGTNFQIRVWNALLDLTPGERASYQELAESIGKPKAARAVGNAMAVNPVGVLIPCHRVIAASGQIGNYKWGSARKRALLAWEAAHGLSEQRSRDRRLRRGGAGT